jgi:hypothetical protein
VTVTGTFASSVSSARREICGAYDIGATVAASPAIDRAGHVLAARLMGLMSG